MVHDAGARVDVQHGVLDGETERDVPEQPTKKKMRGIISMIILETNNEDKLTITQPPPP